MAGVDRGDGRRIKKLGMGKCVRFFNDASIKMKILRGYVLIITLVFLLVLILVSFFLNNYVKKSIYSTMENQNRQIEKSIEYYLNDLIKLSEYPYIDPEVMAILQKGYRADASSRITRLSDVKMLNHLLYKHVFYMNGRINSVWLVPRNMEENPAVKTRQNVNNNYDIRLEDWYETVYNGKGSPFILGIHKDKGGKAGETVVSVARSIVDPRDGSYLGMIVINTLTEDVASFWNTENEGERMVAVADKNGRLIMGSSGHGFSRYLEEKGQELKLNRIYRVKSDGGTYCLVASGLSCMEGRIFQMYSEGTAKSGFRLMYGGILVGGVLVGFLLIFISYAISESVTRPVYQLVESMRAVKGGNLQIQSRKFKGELEVLSQTFNQMVKRMDDMFSQLQLREKQKREMELLALQSQINPHFLYNTLNSVRCMAQMQGADGVTKMLDAMTAVLRYATEDTGEIVPLEKEVDFIKNYIRIINFRYFDRFSFVFQVEEAALDYGTLRFILQPIVENAVFHGFDAKDLYAVVEIKIWTKDDDVRIQITDNGKGMDEKQCEEILKHDNSERRSFNKIGISNVNRRIKMTFGEAYGLRITSRLGMFTRVTIRLPRVMPHKAEVQGEMSYEEKQKRTDC